MVLDNVTTHKIQILNLEINLIAVLLLSHDLCLSARRRFDPSLAVFTRLVMYSFQAGHYATSDLVSQSLHAFS